MATSDQSLVDAGQGVPLQVNSQYDELFQRHLSPAAGVIRNRALSSTRVQVGELKLEMRYYGRTVTGPVTEEQVVAFAREISELADQGWIEHGCLAPLICLELASQLSDNEGNIHLPANRAYYTQKEFEEFPRRIERYCLLFYAASRYSITDLRRRGYRLPTNQVPSDEGAIPPAFPSV